MPSRIEHLNVSKLVAEYAAGASAATLALRHGVGRSTILDRLRVAGARIRRAHEWEEKAIGLTSRDAERFLALLDGLLLSKTSTS
jgi:hypothetical protein